MVDDNIVGVNLMNIMNNQGGNFKRSLSVENLLILKEEKVDQKTSSNRNHESDCLKNPLVDSAVIVPFDQVVKESVSAEETNCLVGFLSFQGELISLLNG
jgi:hypothetical protein